MSPLTLALRVLSIVLLAIALGIVTYVMLSAPSQTAGRLGLRGLKRQAAIRKNELWASIEPLVRWLGVRLDPVLPGGLRASLNTQLSNAGDYLGLSPAEYVGLAIFSGFGLGSTSVLLVYLTDSTPLIAIAGFLIGGMIPYVQIGGEATERLKNISRGLPYVIDLMALSMGAGLDFPGSVRQVVEKSSNPDDPIVEEFTLLLQAITLGRTRKDALLDFSRRAPVDTVREFVSALVQAEERGNPVADVLAIQAGVSRNRRSVRAEEAASKAGVQMVGPLMLAFFAILGLVLGPAMFSLIKVL